VSLSPLVGSLNLAEQCGGKAQPSAIVSPVTLGRLSYLFGEDDQFSSPLRGNPFHFRVKAAWNVENDNLGHSHQPLASMALDLPEGSSVTTASL